MKKKKYISPKVTLVLPDVICDETQTLNRNSGYAIYGNGKESDYDFVEEDDEADRDWPQDFDPWQ
jgi:hypothetical protein